jgi:hypothetical protein
MIKKKESTESIDHEGGFSPTALAQIISDILPTTLRKPYLS